MNLKTERMSPSMKSKSKSKEKASARAGKEQRKSSPTDNGSANHGSGIHASAYNPISGTFHTLETSLVASSAPLHGNSHFPNIDDTDEHSTGPQGIVSEYDSASNNGSCSGESEDPKEKVANSSLRLDIIRSSDNDRREKIRLKNERKHQRQKERRAQELHERCCGYLMSRKLEALAQQLVAMGFSLERATLALMLNGGKLEESISWLFEASEEQAHTKDTTNLVSQGNLKIDISDELAQISAMEVRYNCSKQEVERVVVACEGDLQKAENTLESQKQESFVTPSKPEDLAQINGLMRSQGSPSVSVSMQPRGNESDLKYSKVGGVVSMFPNTESRNLPSLHLNHPNTMAEKIWGVTGSSSSNMLTMASSMQVLPPSVKVETQPSALRNEGRIIQQGVARGPTVWMQHPQFTNAKQNSLSCINALPSGTEGWYLNGISVVENIRSNGKLLQNHNVGSVGTEHLEQFCPTPYKEYPHAFGLVDLSSAGVGGFCKPMCASSSSPTTPSGHNGSWSTCASSHALTIPPSLGLFSGPSAAKTLNSRSRVDWNAGGMMPEFDYTSIDWTLNCPSSTKSGGLWLGISSLLRNTSGNRMGSSCMTELQNVGMARETSSSAGLREWTSPFAGKDIFSVPRQFVTSPTL